MESFTPLINKLRRACIWYASPGLRLEDHSNDIQRVLSGNDNLTASKTAKLGEARKHLLLALGKPGWSEWQESGSIWPPYNCKALPERIRAVWSDSPTESTSIDGGSLLSLRAANRNGAEVKDLVRAGHEARRKKERHLKTHLAAVARYDNTSLTRFVLMKGSETPLAFLPKSQRRLGRPMQRSKSLSRPSRERRRTASSMSYRSRNAATWPDPSIRP